METFMPDVCLSLAKARPNTEVSRNNTILASCVLLKPMRLGSRRVSPLGFMFPARVGEIFIKGQHRPEKSKSRVKQTADSPSSGKKISEP